MTSLVYLRLVISLVTYGSFNRTTVAFPECSLGHP